jgi:hypothetical protein
MWYDSDMEYKADQENDNTKSPQRRRPGSRRSLPDGWNPAKIYVGTPEVVVKEIIKFADTHNYTKSMAYVILTSIALERVEYDLKNRNSIDEFLDEFFIQDGE